MINVYFELVIILVLLQHGFDASGRFTACLVQNNSLKKKSLGKKYSAAFCRRESGKNQITSAFMSAIADCRRELKRLFRYCCSSYQILLYIGIQMVNVITILSMKQLTPQNVNWELRRKGADLDKKGKVAIIMGR